MTLILCFKYTHWTFYHTFFMVGTVVGYFGFLLFINVGGNGMNAMAGYDWRGLVTLLYGEGFFLAIVYMCVCVMLYSSQIPALIRGLFYTSKMHKYQVLTAQNRSFCSFNPPQLCGKGSDQKKQERLNSL